MKANKFSSINKGLISSALLSIISKSAVAQTAIETKVTNLMLMVKNILDIILPVVAIGAFIWLIIGIFTKAQDVKQRAVYFVIGAVLMGLKGSILSILQGI